MHTRPMADVIHAKRLQELGVSKPYSHQLASGARTPSPALALRIFDATGWRLGRLKTASDEDIRALRILFSDEEGSATLAGEPAPVASTMPAGVA